jgi:hypothetical protein
MSSRQTEKEQRRAERLAAEREAAESERRRRLMLIGGGAAAALVAIVVVVVLHTSGSSSGSGGSSGSDATPAATRPGGASPADATLPGAQTGPPPWNAGGDQLQQRLDALGLPALAAEGTVLHIHQHLDLFVDGKRVTVPAGIGIDPAQQFIAPLHTHDPSGLLHVESDTQQTFTLGQIFGVWGVPLNPTTLGGLRTGAGKQLKTWVNGKPLRGDPGKINLASHQEIVIAYGTPAQMPKPVPASYSFGPGE